MIDQKSEVNILQVCIFVHARHRLSSFIKQMADRFIDSAIVMRQKGGTTNNTRQQTVRNAKQAHPVPQVEKNCTTLSHQDRCERVHGEQASQVPCSM